MLSVSLRKQTDAPIRILCLGAHCDDIEIGCGGTILTLLETYRKAAVDWVVFSSDQQRASEARESANLFLKQAESTAHKKIANILECFRSQRTKHWFDDQTFLSMLRLRGMESNAPDRYAEAFYSRKTVIA